MRNIPLDDNTAHPLNDFQRFQSELLKDYHCTIAFLREHRNQTVPLFDFTRTVKMRNDILFSEHITAISRAYLSTVSTLQSLSAYRNHSSKETINSLRRAFKKHTQLLAKYKSLYHSDTVTVGFASQCEQLQKITSATSALNDAFNATKSALKSNDYLTPPTSSKTLLLHFITSVTLAIGAQSLSNRFFGS